MLIDLHNHTAPQSWDSLLSPDDLASGAKEAGLGGICLTEHDQFWDHQDTRDLGRRHGILVLPGVEITTEGGHLLVFGLEGYVFGMHRADFVKAEVDRVGGAILAAHPYRRNFHEGDGPWVPPYEEQIKRAQKNPLLQVADGIETLNGRGSDQQNRFSADLCRDRGMHASGASDTHAVKDIATYATEFERPIADLQDLIKELRAGRFQPVDLRNGSGRR